ncbi:acetate/propionate family kinase [Acetobacter papayae]|uniref:acetate/propionate family kinase n=1 Tax=Acetobacter papayae TaxID=1076592 RepID=UPI0039EA6DB6
MAGVILVFNVGSSSVKFTVFDVGAGITAQDAPIRLVHGEIENHADGFSFHVNDRTGTRCVDEQITTTDPHPLDHLLKWLSAHAEGRSLLGVGHRIVHGGPEFSAPVRITPDVLDQLEALTPFAPLHQPATLAPARAIADYRPDLLQVACFDTAFHQTIPEMARLLPLPRRYAQKGVQRYGFHGLSYTWIAERLKLCDPALYAGRTLIAHLGSGASLCALKGGKSLETTMGFSALDGLMMGTRTGMIDPGALLYMMQEEGAGWCTLVDVLYRQSGLLGVSGVSSDMRLLRQRLVEEKDPEISKAVAQALDLFEYRIIEETGALAAVMEGLDGLVFTAGIGEHDSALRANVCARLGWLGVKLDAKANACHASVISTPDSAVRVRVEPTDEEAVIMRDVLAFITQAPA